MKRLGGPHECEHEWRTDSWGSRLRRFFDRMFRIEPPLAWDWSWSPRRCNKCGFIHPEDALQLVQEGWRVEFPFEWWLGCLTPPNGWLPYPHVQVNTADFDAITAQRWKFAIRSQDTRAHAALLKAAP